MSVQCLPGRELCNHFDLDKFIKYFVIFINRPLMSLR